MRISTFPLLSLLPLVAAHARIKSPIPLGAPPEDISGNDYNAPLAPDGSQFPCNHLHTNPNVDQTPTQSWRAGSLGSFEILGHVTAGEGALAAHSGGSCQASISFDNGRSFRVLHTYHGGCPRDVPFGSNFAGPNQTFAFSIPPTARAGPALFSWTWIAVSGNRDEFYMNCAAVSITGDGTSTLDTAEEGYPPMYVGDMNIPGQIADGECRSTAGTALLYPDPGPKERVTVSEVQGIPFLAPSKGKCVSPGGPPVVAPSSAVVSSATSPLPKPTGSVPPAVLLPTDAASSAPAVSASASASASASSSYTATEAIPSFISASSSAAPPIATSAAAPVVSAPAYTATEAIPSFISASSAAPAVPTSAAPPAYTATEAIPSFISASSPASSLPTPAVPSSSPAYTPTEAVPSFIPSSFPAASRCSCASTATFTITLAAPPPPSATATNTYAHSHGHGHSGSLSYSHSHTASPGPSATEGAEEESGSDGVVTLYTTVTSTVCPEASVIAAKAACEAAARRV